MLPRAIATTGGGFLLAVLWFDLKFDLLALDSLREGRQVAPEVLNIVKNYYARVLQAEQSGFPLIMAAMLLTIAGALLQLREAAVPRLGSIVSLMLILPPVMLAIFKVVPDASLLSSQDLAINEQSKLAVSILVYHLYCFASVLGFLLLQLWMTHAKSASRSC